MDVTMNAIEVSDFVKSYGATTAVSGVSLMVKSGELFGLIGPDGAGKTTLMRTICTLILPDKGTLFVKGLDVTRRIAEIRSQLGYMPQRFSLYQDLSIEQNLRFFADLFQVPAVAREQRLQQLYQFSRLAPFKDRRAAALSGGMKQKLALSCALIHTPSVLILDEPTYGVDPVSRQEFWEILHSIQLEGTTILVSTAYMDEADQCDRVALMFRGQLVGLGTPAELKQGYRYPLYKLYGRDLHQLRQFFLDLTQVHTIQLFGDSLHISFKKMPAKQDWQTWQEATAMNLQHWQKQPPSIEDVFLDLMGEPA